MSAIETSPTALGLLPGPITIGPSGEKEQPRRSLQIEAIGDAWKGVKPRIRIGGQWLERAGFKPGTRVSVTCRETGFIELRAFSSTGGQI